VSDPLAILVLLTALGCALIGGVFFAFSNFVMQGLGRTSGGMAAMQSINVTVLNSTFLGIFFGTGIGCLVLAGVSLARWEAAGSARLLAGSLLYLIGNIAVTMFFNVPRNEALRRGDAASREGAALWADYRIGWTRWNHVRTVTALAAATLLGSSKGIS
jgi:uncharacterized membrane protein